jgi:hypothetical protein
MQLLDGNQVKGLIKKKFDDVQRRINSRSDDGEVLSNIFFLLYLFCLFYWLQDRRRDAKPFQD